MNLIRLWLIYGTLLVLFFIIEQIFLGVQITNAPLTGNLSLAWLIIPILYLFYIAFKPRKTK